MNSERFAGLVGNLQWSGLDLPDDVLLDDLFNYHDRSDAGLSAGNPPESWIKAVSMLASNDKVILSSAIGRANRAISRRMTKESGVKTNATLGDLRKYPLADLLDVSFPRDKRMSNDSIDLLHAIFVNK